MKRISAIILALALLLCCCGCGKTENAAFRTLEVLGDKHYSVICRKDDRLAPAINAAMNVLAAQTSLSSISLNWLKQDRITLSGDFNALSALEDLPEGRTLLFGVEKDFNPMAFTENGELKGMSIDIGKALGDALGCEVRFIPIVPSEVGTQLASGNIDCAIGFDSGLVSESKYSVGVSYMESKIVLSVRSNSEVRRIKDIKGQRIGTVNDPAVVSAVKVNEKITKFASGATVYLSPERCVAALDCGWCAAVAMDSLMLSYFPLN